MANELVLLHGFTQTGGSWEPVRREVDERYRAHAADLRGHGAASERLPASFEAVIEDLAALVDGPFALAGYSMGGRIALHLALAQPELVTRLVLISTTAGIEDPAERARRRAQDEAVAAEIERDGVAAFAERWAAGPLFAGQPPEVAALAHEDRLGHSAAQLASTLRGLGTGTMEPVWHRLHELTMPAMVLVGERDAKFRALGERLAAGLPAAELRVVREAGHALHLEAPEAVADAL